MVSKLQFRIYFHLAFNFFYQFSLTVFEMLFSLSIINSYLDGLKASLVFIVSTITVLVFNPPVSKIIDKLELHDRLHVNAFLRLSSSIFIMIGAFLNPQTDFWWIILLIFFSRICFCSANNSTLFMPYFLQNVGIFHLNRYYGISSIVGRGIYVLAPGVSLLALDFTWFWSALCLAIIVMFCSYGALFLKPIILRKSINNLKPQVNRSRDSSSLTRVVIWHNTLHFLTSLSIGGVTFLLTFLIKMFSQITLGILTPFSFLYGALILFMIVCIIFPTIIKVRDKAIPRTLNFLVLALSFLFFMLTYCIDKKISWILWFVIGGVYAFLLFILSTKINHYFYNYKNFTNIIAQSQAFSQAGSMLGTLSIGMLINLQVSSTYLILFPSIFLSITYVISNFLLYNFKNIQFFNPNENKN